ncbi:MAG: hypothetical protein IPJ65_39260 [Archangiaceae bacterium]|nr:hypothetical protein [Archangiaceae bacterium]
MSVEEPKDVAEWKAHLDGLSGLELRDKAQAANSMQFVELLQEDGFSADDIEAIFVLIAKRLVANGQVPPFDGLYDYSELARR